MKQLRIFGLLVAVLLMGSCDKGEDEATGIGDVMIMSKRSGTGILYGLSINAYTLSSFSSVTAVGSADPGKTYTSKASQGFKTFFTYETPANEMTASPPGAADFSFTATFENGVNQQFEDLLTRDALLPSTIDTLQFNAVKNQLRISWSAVTGADSYMVDIMEGTTLVFSTPELVNTVKAITIAPQLPSAASGFKPVSGKTYIARVRAYQYETEVDFYNFQAVSTVERSIVWPN